MSPHEDAVGRSLASVDEHLRSAAPWVASGDYVAEGTGDMPSIPDFEDQFCGEWTSFKIPEQLADDIGLLNDAPEELARYFNWDAWTRDLAFDFTTSPAPAGGVFRLSKSLKTRTTAPCAESSARYHAVTYGGC